MDCPAKLLEEIEADLAARRAAGEPIRYIVIDSIAGVQVPDRIQPGVLKPGEARLMQDLPECPGPDCLMCNGEACDYCGAGCWRNGPGRPLCEHDVIDRHQPPPTEVRRP